MKCPIPSDGKSSPLFQYTSSSFFPPASFLKIFSATTSSSAFEIVSFAFLFVSTASGFEEAFASFFLESPNEEIEIATTQAAINNLHFFLFIKSTPFLLKIQSNFLYYNNFLINFHFFLS